LSSISTGKGEGELVVLVYRVADNTLNGIEGLAASKDSGLK
jgi:hypothetical protein